MTRARTLRALGGRAPSVGGLAVFVALVAGCAVDDGVHIEERDGVVHVLNQGSGTLAERDDAVRFELEQSYGVDEASAEAALYRVAYLAIDDDGHVYVFDRGDDRLIAFAQDGSLLWSAGRTGQGPGEFERGRGLVWDGAETLLVAHGGGTRVDRWSKDGQYLDRVDLTALELSGPRLVGRLSTGELVFRTSLPGRLGSGVAIVDPDLGRVLRRWEVRSGADRAIPGGVSVSSDVRVVGGRIAAGDLGVYQLRLFGVSGALSRVIHWNSDHLVGPGYDAERRTISSYGELSAPFPVAGGHLVTSAFWPTNVTDPDLDLARRMAGDAPPLEWASSVDVFDADGRLLRSTITEGSSRPDLGTLLASDAAGRLYTFAAEPFPQVRRYRVVVAD